MKRKFTKLLAAFALLVFMMPSLVAWGQTRATETFTYSDYKGEGGPSGTGSEYTMVKPNVSIKDTKFYGNTSYAHFYANGVTTILPSSGVTITKIELTASSSNYNGFQSSGSVTPSTGSVSANGTIVTWTGTASSDFTISHNKQIRWTTIEVTYTVSGGTPTCATPTFNPAAGLYTTAQNVTISTETSGATIRYTTDGTDPTESSSVYSASISVSANTTIKAMATATGYNNSSIATANYYFVEHAGTAADPYSVADARSAIDAGMGVTEVYATGIVSEIVTAYDPNFGNISYNISTDGTTTAAQLQAFRGKSFDGANFTSADDILVGDRVVVKGNLTKFNDTYEFAQNNQLVSQTHPSTIVIPSSELALPCTENNNGSFTVTYTNSFVSALTTADLFDNETCTEAFTDDWIILDNIDDPYNTIPFVLEANPSKTPRTVYMKVEAVNSDNYLIERVFTIIQEGQPTYTVTYDANGGGGTMTDPDSPYIAGDIVELLTNTFTAPDGKMWDSWVVTDAGNNTVAVEGGMFEMPASNVTVTAQWVIDPNAPQYEWVLTDLADLTSTDIFVIVGTRDAASYYGMSNDNGTSTQPSAVGVTIANNKLSSDPADNIKWNVSGDNTNGYVFYPNGSTTTWLYCNTTASSSSNTNMRVGTGDRKLFVLDNNNYLVTKDEYTDRYVSLNGSTDWRGYTTTGQATVISFFKRQVASTDPAVYTSISAIDLAYDETGSSFTYSLENTASEYTMNVTVNSEAQSWLSASINTATSTVTITAAVNDDVQREGIVTVNYLEGGIIKAYEQVTVTQAKFVIDYATLPFVFFGNEDETPTGVTTTAGTYSASPYLKFDGTGKYLTLKLNDAPLSLSYDIKVNGNYSPSSVFDVQTSPDGLSWTTLVSYTTMSSDVQTVTHLDLPSTARYIKWIYTYKSSGNVGLGNIRATANYDIYGDVTVANLTIPSTKVCTIYDGGTLNATNWLGNDGNAANLIIKDGGQLKTPTSVYATVEKNITGYGDANANTNKGYYLVSAPAEKYLYVALNNDDVDAYLFDASEQGAEWRNFKLATGAWNVSANSAVLYASKNDCTLSLDGNGIVYNHPNPGANEVFNKVPATTSSVNVGVRFNNGKTFQGWNLIGNPFTCKAYLADGSDFYRMNADGNGLIINTDAQGGGNAINVCEGIFVMTSASETSVTFTTTDPTVTSTGNNNGMVNISVAQVVNSRDTQPSADYARIRINNGKDMTKFVFNENTSRVYIPQGNKDYAVVRSEARGEMPVNFKAAENGTYTINVEAENLEVNYLHLIDNLTGMDVDLLATPSYTFEGKKSDYASRFRLVFDANTGNDETNDNFAFINNGELIVNGNGTVQVIDILGRQMFSHEVNSAFRIQNSSFAPGVYVLRLVNGNDVKTQKIVIK